MFLNVALYTGLFLAGVLAVPSGLGARLARRRESPRSQLNQRLESDASARSSELFSPNWAGAILSGDPGTFTNITGTFSVPTPTGPAGASAAVWVGIDDGACSSAGDSGVLQSGVNLTVSSDGGPAYTAWYAWLPEGPSYFSGISISAGDIVKLTVEVTSSTSGIATVQNLSNNQTVSADLTSEDSLCQANAEWIVEDYAVGDKYVPFANFGTVEFTNTGPYSPSGATIVEMVNQNEIVTSVSTSDSSVSITYVQ